MSQSGEHAEGAGPFTTRLTWQLHDGATAIWESRPVRKRGLISVRAAGGDEFQARRADRVTLLSLRRLNTTAAVAFIVGGALFAIGAGVSQFGSASAVASASIYFVGGLFFNAGGYVSLLQVINAPQRDSHRGSLATVNWKWWSYEPGRIDWLSNFTLFAGTLVFGINLLDSFLPSLSAQQEDRLVWAPDLVGCILFLIAGHLALLEVCHGRLGVRARDLGWWIVAVNQVGSVLFLISALAAFTRPMTDNLVNTGVANVGTLAGALCFSAGGLLQLYERPDA